MTDVPVDAFGHPMRKCAFWCCPEFIRDKPGQRFCSRQCKSAASQRRTRQADSTRLKRQSRGREEGYEDGFLYVIQAGHEPVVKIGYSRSLSERLRTLNTAHYHELRVVASRPVKRFHKNDPPDKELHDALPESDRMKGEWWRLTGEVLAVLGEHDLTPLEGLS